MQKLQHLQHPVKSNNPVFPVHYLVLEEHDLFQRNTVKNLYVFIGPQHKSDTCLLLVPECFRVQRNFPFQKKFRKVLKARPQSKTEVSL